MRIQVFTGPHFRKAWGDDSPDGLGDCAKQGRAKNKRRAKSVISDIDLLNFISLSLGSSWMFRFVWLSISGEGG